jgi:thiamine pyrophosphate-dependent acetolactate synthase large subunit-like protein
VPLGWRATDWVLRGPLDYLGQDGGAGLGSGPGMAVGAALALEGSGRLPVAILGDGDMLMGATALWTAARYRIPLLVIVANNRTYLNDEAHQERVATVRGRPVENRSIGQRIDDPAPDFASLAASLGLHGIGPVTTAGELDAALRTAIDAVSAGAAVVVDVHVAADAYPGGPTIARHSGKGH